MIGGIYGDDDDDKMCMSNDLGWLVTDDNWIIWHCRRSELDDKSGMMNGDCYSMRDVYSYPTDLSSAVIFCTRFSWFFTSPSQYISRSLHQIALIPSYPRLKNHTPLTHTHKHHNLTISTPLSTLPKPPLLTPSTLPPFSPLNPPQRLPITSSPSNNSPP